MKGVYVVMKVDQRGPRQTSDDLKKGLNELKVGRAWSAAYCHMGDAMALVDVSRIKAMTGHLSALRKGNYDRVCLYTLNDDYSTFSRITFERIPAVGGKK